MFLHFQCSIKTKGLISTFYFLFNFITTSYISELTEVIFDNNLTLEYKV